jgi:BirA family biotin operon repressor/biotin-[acetyl-CoA-carboxylase] ligase
MPVVKKRLIKRIARTESTNSLAMELAMAGTAAGTVVVAETQTSGRGRLQREWFSPPGTGLYFSVVLRPQLPVVDLPKITLAAGVALCEALEQACQVAPGLKWPNDLLLDGKKCGGILCETGPLSGAADHNGIVVILGVGLNVTTPAAAFPEGLRPKATSLVAVTGRAYDKEEILTIILSRLGPVMTSCEAGEFGDILARWRARDVLVGRKLRWLDPAGRIVTGCALGIDDNGQYHIRADDGTVHPVVSGDITLAVP